MLCGLLIQHFSFGQVTQTFTTTGSNSFTVPAGVTSLLVECWGGGGAGGGCTNTSNVTGGGGSGGAYSKEANLLVTPCSTYNVIVGAGGVGVSARAGGAGGSSSFGNSLTASGGSGGGVNGSAANGIGADISIGNTYDGGAGGTGSSGTSGGGGGGAGSASDGGDAAAGTAGAAGSGGGGAGAAGRNTNGTGNAGNAPGGGGSGGRNGNASSTQIGGVGGRGQVKITYTCINYSINSTSATNVCSGTSSLITVTGNTAFLPEGTYTVTYNLGAPNTTTGATATMQVNASGVGTFNTSTLANQGSTTITITNIKSGSGTGCSSAISTNRTATFSVYTQPNPIIEFTQGGHDTLSSIPVCGQIGGGGQNDMDIASGNPGGASVIQWQISYDGSSWQDAPGPTAIATQYVLNPVYCSFESVAGTYYFRVVITNGTCVGTSSRIKLVVTGTSNLTAGAIGADQNFCLTGDPANLTQMTAPTGGSGTYTYQWQSSTDSINFNVIAGATASTYNPPVVNQTTYYRRITISGGCRAYSNVVTVLITTSVPVAPGNISGYTNVCANSNGFAYSINAINGVSSYAWTLPTGWSVTAGSGTTNITVSSGTVTQSGNIIVSAVNVCGTGLGSVIAVNTTAGSTQAVISGNKTICAGSSAQLSVDIIGGAAPYTLTYNNGTANVVLSGYQSGDLIEVSPAATANYSIVSVASVGGCTGSGNQGTALVTIATAGTWLGVADNDWNNPANWCGGVPNTMTDVIIPSGTPNTPNVMNEMALANNLTVASGAELIVSGQKLLVNGTITAIGNINTLGGTISLEGSTVAQTISGSMFYQHRIKNLRISNPAGVSLTGSNDTLLLTGVLDFGRSNCIFNTNGNLTLYSSASGTASVADMTSNGLYSNNRILGNVTVEKYIPLQPKAWHFITSPTTGQTIKAAWQENNSTLSYVNSPGYGTIITSNLSGATTSLGFDIYTPAGSTMKVYNSTTDAWEGVASTYNLIDNPKGYMVFIRGDRSVTAYNQAPTATKMRTTGQLFTAVDNPPVSINVNADKFESVGNPYACAVDFAKLPKAGGLQDVFYIWDPALTLSQYSAYGYGAYQTFISNGSGYDIIPGGGSFTSGYKGIPSGQSFFIRASGAAGQLSFSENSKVTDTGVVSRVNDQKAKLKMNFSVVSNANPVLLDGVMAMFDEEYSDSIDQQDIPKMGNNLSENVGIYRNNKRWACERRTSISMADTIFLQFNGLKRVTYRLDFIPSNFAPNADSAWLFDKYLNTSTSISLDSSQSIQFAVDNNPLSSASDRFYIKIEPVVTHLITEINANAVRSKENQVMLNGEIENASKGTLHIYKSHDAVHFKEIAVMDNLSSKITTFKMNYFDVESSGQITYYKVIYQNKPLGSSITKLITVPATSTSNDFSFGPNPVTDQYFTVYSNSGFSGKYIMSLYLENGQLAERQYFSKQNQVPSFRVKLSGKIKSGQYKMKWEADGKLLWTGILRVM